MLAIGALAGLVWKRYQVARALAAGQAALIVLGFGAAQFPMLVAPQFTIENSAADATIHRLLLGALGAGSVVLLPSLFLLFHVFKGRTPERLEGSPTRG